MLQVEAGGLLIFQLLLGWFSFNSKHLESPSDPRATNMGSALS